MVNYGSEAVLGPPPHNDFQLKDRSAKKIGGSMKSRTGVYCSLLYTHAQNCPKMTITVMNKRPALPMKRGW